MMSRRPARARRSMHRCNLVAMVLLAAAAPGCKQSLFDSDPGEPDAGQSGADDAGNGGPDAGDDDPDAAPVATCPAPCVGDAFADFAESQGGPEQRWSYLVDVDAPNGVEYAELDFATWNGIEAWTTGNGGPAIATCRDQTDAACAGLDDFLLLAPGAAGAQRPALSFRLPEDATYRVSGALRVADGSAVDVPVHLIVSRAGRHDAIAVQSFRTSEEERPLSALVPGLEGDELTFTFGSNEDAPPLGVRVFITRIDEGEDAFPGTCQAALRFDPGNSLVESCRDVTVQDLHDSIGPPGGVSSPGPGPSERLGEGRSFVEGTYLQLGNSPMDYSGDFTVQFWVRFDEPLPFNATVYADWHESVRGGLNITADSDDPIAYSCHMVNGTVSSPEDCLSGDRPMDGNWHFWRTVRSTDDGSLTLCIDGIEKVRAPIPASGDLTSDEPPRVARNVVYNPAYMVGAVDEVRVFGEALPCTTPLR